MMVHKLEVLGFTKAVLLEVFPMSPDDAEEDESSKMFFDTQHCKIDLKTAKLHRAEMLHRLQVLLNFVQNLSHFQTKYDARKYCW